MILLVFFIFYFFICKIPVGDLLVFLHSNSSPHMGRKEEKSWGKTKNNQRNKQTKKSQKKKNPNLSITGRRLSREMPSFVLFPPFEMKIWLSVPSHQRCLQDLLHCWLKRKYVWFAALHSLIQLGQCPVNASENGAPSTSVCG